MISEAWNRVTKETIRNCYHHAGFKVLLNIDEHFTPEDDLPLSVWLQEIENVEKQAQGNWDEFVNIDSDLQTTYDTTIEEVLQEEQMNEEDTSEEENDSKSSFTLKK